jgi:indolepyruvate ferredoxin oxidoreductase beta subunit
MQTNIIIAGVGGQGILTIASIIDLAAMQQGLFVKQAEVHGMSQRGGAVESHLRISDSEIYSDLIPKGKADLILAIEPMEALRYLPFLSPAGIIVTATEPFINISNYPDVQAIREAIVQSGKHHFVDAEALAREAGNLKAFNTVMLGAASHYTGIADEALKQAIGTYFASKGEAIVALNIKAFELGAEQKS